LTHPLPARLTRTVDLYGAGACAAIGAGGAIVVGLGGVGAHAAVALARCGIGRLHLIDDDRVTTSSLNRHPAAGPADVGRAKTEVLATFLRTSCPDTVVTLASARVTAGTVGDLVTADALAGGRDATGGFPVLVDAIDSVADKVALLVHGVRLAWPTVCSLGAAGKRDAGSVRTGTLAATRVCPLARVVRRGVREAGVDPASIGAVWSEEPPLGPVTVTPGTQLADEPDLPRRQPSNMMLPGMFGFALANLAVEILAARA
jgi:tRNA A37 threonylcarbamoyladenosine dehydratase